MATIFKPFGEAKHLNRSQSEQALRRKRKKGGTTMTANAHGPNKMGNVLRIIIAMLTALAGAIGIKVM